MKRKNVKVNKIVDEDLDENRMDTYEALEKAVQAFEKHLSGLGYDTSHWYLKVTAWGLSVLSSEPLWKIDLDLREGKVLNQPP